MRAAESSPRSATVSVMSAAEKVGLSRTRSTRWLERLLTPKCTRTWSALSIHIGSAIAYPIRRPAQREAGMANDFDGVTRCNNKIAALFQLYLPIRTPWKEFGAELYSAILRFVGSAAARDLD